MAHLRSLPLYIVACALLCCSALMAQEYAPAVRIVERVDASRLVTLKGNTHPYASTQNDRGRVSSDLRMTDLILVLSRDADQQAAFDKFVASQYEQGSSNFHHWLTAEEVGQKFGPAEGDIAAVTSWLTGSGFSVDEVSKDHMSIRFSGTAGQVESSFHIEIHSLEAKGELHIGNMTDPQIPSALAPAVVGVKALHNFFARPQHHLGQIVTRNAKTGKWERTVSGTAAGVKTEATATSAKALPQFGITVGSGSSAYLVEDVTPYDFAKIYNVLPLWNASTPIDGTGQTIAIAGTSGIKPSDVTTFRTTFGLPTTATANTPKLISGNSMPVTICSGSSTSVPYSGNYCNLNDQFENALDVEWSGGVAKGAQIVLVSSYPASASDDTLYDSESYIVNNKATLNASVMSVSYGLCELGMGTAGNAQYNTLWQTAAAEGIAVFVSTGDQGSAVCDAGMDSSVPYGAMYGLSVNGLASTPYNTAVGGTDLNWGSTASPYWSTSNASTGLNALGYMPEVPWNDSCTNPLAVTYIQEWATYIGVSGVTDAETACSFVVNYYYSIYKNYGTDLSGFVDITGGSGGVSACTTSNGSTVASCSGGYAKPSWQTGVTGIPSDGKRDLPDVSFFASNGFLGSAYLVCVSANGSCTYSTTSEPTTQEVGGTSASSPAMAGVMALINQKAGSAQGNPNSEFYALAAKQTYANCTTESVTNSSSCYFNDIDTGTIAVPCVSGYPNCTVSHSGDSVGILTGWAATTGYDLATGLGSLNVANVVNAWTSAVGTASATVTVTPAKTSLSLNQSLSVTVTVASSTSGGTTPTGTVTLTGGGITAMTGTLASGSYTFTIAANSLTGGSDTLTASYSGDPTYAVATGTASVAVTLLTPTVTVTPSPATLGANVIEVVTVNVTGAGVTPTGTVTLSGGGYTSTACTLASGACTINIPSNTLSNGTDTLTVTYSGDSSYNPASGTATVTVSILTPTVTVTPASTSATMGNSLGVTVSVSGTGATPTGTATLTVGTYSSGALTLSGGSYAFTIPAASLSVGTDAISVNYAGDSIYRSATGTASVTVSKQTPTITVTPSVSSLNSNQSLTVSGTVTGSGTAPTGTMTLAGGGYTATAVTLSSGSYSFTIPSNSLIGGTDVLVVGYSGDANYILVSKATSVTVTKSTFSLSASTSNISLTAGGSTANSVTVTGAGGYVGAVTLTASVSPSGSTAPTVTISNSPVTLSATTTTGTGTVTVGTNATTTPSVKLARNNAAGWFKAAGGTAIAALLFFFLPLPSKRWRQMLSALLLAVAVSFAAVGCGGGGGGGTTTTLLTPTVTVKPAYTTMDVTDPLSVAVTVTGSGSTPTGTVSLSGGGYTLSSQTLSSGAVNISIPKSSFTSTGSVTLTATYGGDTSYNSASGTATVTVKTATTAGTYTVTVTGTGNDSAATTATPITFTVTVTN